MSLRFIKGLQTIKCTRAGAWFNDVSSREELKCLFAGAGAFVFHHCMKALVFQFLRRLLQALRSSPQTLLPCLVSMGIGIEIDPMHVDAIADSRHIHELPDLDSRIAAGKRRASG